MNQAIIDFIDNPAQKASRPSVTLSYAQSLDGSLTIQRGVPTAISGPESLKLTHQLRAHHDAILIGIGTLLADDPGLNVREVDGPDPQPIILDSQLRTPLTAKMFNNSKKPWIFCVSDPDQNKQSQLEEKGAQVFPIESNHNRRLSLSSLLKKMTVLSIKNLMLEGGATLISSFLADDFVDKAVITISPQFLGGLRVLESPLSQSDKGYFPRLINTQSKPLGVDLILWGEFK